MDRACRDRRDRGAALVEFALVMPLLMALLVGAVTAGVAYDRNNSLNNGARESSRFGATLPVTSGLSTWLNDVADVARDSTAGELEAMDPGQRICVAYVYPSGAGADDQTVRVVEVAGVRTVTVGSTCFTDGRPADERRVQVRLQRDTDFDAVFFTSTLTLDTRSVVRFERGGT